MAKKKEQWLKVVSLSDCTFEDWDTEKESPICPFCGLEYNDCNCPGPGSDDVFKYQEIDGVLYAKKKEK